MTKKLMLRHLETHKIMNVQLIDCSLKYLRCSVTIPYYTTPLLVGASLSEPHLGVVAIEISM